MNKKHGFTIAELMVGCTILVILLGAFLGAFQNILKVANYSQGLSLAYTACLSQLEEMVSHDFSSLKTDYAAAWTTPGWTFAPAGFPADIKSMGNITITDRSDLYGGNWTAATTSAAWLARMEHTSLVYDNRMWIMGGAHGPWRNDVWSSTDGINWTEALPNVNRWPGRCQHTSLVYGNKMWVMGGNALAWVVNDVWYSNDGVNWNQATSAANWPARAGHSSLVYNNRMWVMGGFRGDTMDEANDIWSSTDGINWTEALPNVNRWPARECFTSLVYNNKMWVMGGVSSGGSVLNDVWSSTDGINWTQATSAANWSARAGLTSLVYDNKMWVLGGGWGVPFPKDVWYSNDGINWIQATNAANWVGRHYHTSLVYNNRMWVISGNTNQGDLPDVWSSAGYDRLLEVKITVCWKQPDGRMFGEDTNLNGVLDPGEDVNPTNNQLDSPAQLRILLSEKNMLDLKKIFLGRQ